MTRTVMHGSGTFLDRTDQNWKYKLVANWLPLLTLSVWFLAFSVIGTTWVSFFIVYGSSLVYMAGTTWVAYSIRCPTCRTRLYLKVRRECGFLRFTRAFLQLSECPTCGTDWSTGAGARRTWQPEPRYWTLKRIALVVLAVLLAVALPVISALIADWRRSLESHSSLRKLELLRKNAGSAAGAVGNRQGGVGRS